MAVDPSPRVALEASHGVEDHVVVGVVGVLPDDRGSPRPDAGLLAPAVDHGERHVGVVPHVDLGDTDVEGVVGVMRCGASGDDLQGRVVVDDDQVVDVLNGLVRLDHHACLDGILDVVSGFHVDEVPVGVLEVALGGVLVLGWVHGLPHVVLNPVVLLEGLPGGHELQSLLLGRVAVAHAVVQEHQCAGAVHLVRDDADLLHVVLVLGVLQVADLLGVPCALVVVLEVDVLSVRALLAQGILHRLIIGWHVSHSPYPFSLISFRRSPGLPEQWILPFLMT